MMSKEHHLLIRCERFMMSVEALFYTLPEHYRTRHLVPKSKALRHEIRKAVPTTGRSPDTEHEHVSSGSFLLTNPGAPDLCV